MAERALRDYSAWDGEGGGGPRRPPRRSEGEVSPNMIVGEFKRRFETAHGRPYMYADRHEEARDIAIASNLIARHGEQGALAIVRHVFEYYGGVYDGQVVTLQRFGRQHRFWTEQMLHESKNPPMRTDVEAIRRARGGAADDAEFFLRAFGRRAPGA